VSQILLSKNFIRNTCKLALNEDLFPSGDITSDLLDENYNGITKLIVNENAIIGGLEFAKQTFSLIDKKIIFKSKVKEGSFQKKGNIIATVKGNIKHILTGERVALNFVSHISGIATKTNKFVNLVGKKTKICCTRKTIPNMRVIQKYAVKLGGGINHRFNLSDEYLIKDNHIGTKKNFEEIIEKAIKQKKAKKITVEVDKISQLKKILKLKFDRILFDNMSPSKLRQGIRLVNKKFETEASGGINFRNVKSIAKTGVNRISIGSLTHSVKSVDVKLEL